MKKTNLNENNYTNWKQIKKIKTTKLTENKNKQKTTELIVNKQTNTKLLN
jgi:hypothetical protein